MHDVEDLSGEIVAEVRRLSITVSKGRQDKQAETTERSIKKGPEGPF
jgi:hypothetical protein